MNDMKQQEQERQAIMDALTSIGYYDVREEFADVIQKHLSKLRKNQMTVDEQKAIEEAAKESASCYPDWCENKDDLANEFEKGANFALCNFREPSEPSEAGIKELVEFEYDMELQNLSDRLGVNEAFKEGIRVGVEAGMKRSDGIRKPSEDLVQRIEDILRTEFRLVPGQYGYHDASTEIAKLLPSSRSQEKDVNAELLDALIIARDRMFKESGSCPREVVIAIANAEKQTKQ